MGREHRYNFFQEKSGLNKRMTFRLFIMLIPPVEFELKSAGSKDKWFG